MADNGSGGPFPPLLLSGVTMQPPKPKPDRRSGGPRFDTFTHRNRKVRIPVGYLAVGMIIGPHGLRGEMKVEIYSDYPARFDAGNRLWVGEALEQMEILSSRPHKGQMLVTLSGVVDRTEAEERRGEWLFIREQEAADLEEDTYFVHDIIGMAVETTEGRPLGVVNDILFTGANEVYVVAPPDAPDREILLPAIADVIQQVDLDSGVITVSLLPGLLEE